MISKAIIVFIINLALVFKARAHSNAAAILQNCHETAVCKRYCVSGIQTEKANWFFLLAVSVYPIKGR